MYKIISSIFCLGLLSCATLPTSLPTAYNMLVVKYFGAYEDSVEEIDRECASGKKSFTSYIEDDLDDYVERNRYKFGIGSFFVPTQNYHNAIVGEKAERGWYRTDYIVGKKDESCDELQAMYEKNKKSLNLDWEKGAMYK